MLVSHAMASGSLHMRTCYMTHCCREKDLPALHNGWPVCSTSNFLSAQCRDTCGCSGALCKCACFTNSAVPSKGKDLGLAISQAGLAGPQYVAADLAGIPSHFGIHMCRRRTMQIREYTS